MISHRIHDMYVIQNDAISRVEGSWLQAMITGLGPEFFQTVSQQTISLLNILSGSMLLNTPLPPFLQVPRSALFRILQTEREPKEMSLEHVGESGYAVFAVMSVTSQRAGQEIERCVELVRSLVGEVDMEWKFEDENVKNNAV
jgi:hypothetical protein